MTKLALPYDCCVMLTGLHDNAAVPVATSDATYRVCRGAASSLVDLSPAYHATFDRRMLAGPVLPASSFYRQAFVRPAYEHKLVIGGAVRSSVYSHKRQESDAQTKWRNSETNNEKPLLVPHENLARLQAGDRREASVGDLLAEFRNGAQVAVVCAASRELPGKVLADAIGRRAH